MVENNNNTNNKVESLPAGLADDKTIKTKVTSLKKIIEDKLLQLQDLATMEIMLPISVRLRQRHESILKAGRAQNLKIEGHWKTIPPKFHMCKLEASKISNEEARISFSVYETDSEGNKVSHPQTTEIIMADGSKVNRVTSEDYRISYEVIETIKSKKPITREVRKIERIN